jgi:ubiquinone/menaquinone biosynthesis C-methylase UbiE
MAPAFDDQAAAYDRWYVTPLGRLVDLVEKEALFALLPGLAGCRVLEVGCGTGNISLALAQRGAKVVGIDVSAPMLAAARRKMPRQGPPLHWVGSQAGVLPFPDQSFDGVVSVLALDFMADRPGVVRASPEALKKRWFKVKKLLTGAPLLDKKYRPVGIL